MKFEHWDRKKLKSRLIAYGWHEDVNAELTVAGQQHKYRHLSGQFSRTLRNAARIAGLVK